MAARSTLLLAFVLGLVGSTPILADEREDRARQHDVLLGLEKESWELARRRDVEGLRAFFPDDVVLILEDGTRLNKAGYLALFKEVNAHLGNPG